MRHSLLARVPVAARLALPLAAALAVAACGSGGSAPQSGASSAAAGSSSSASGQMTHAVLKTSAGPAGVYLTDGSGRAVYLFKADSMGKSACSGACAKAWPPVTTVGAPTASGAAKASDLGTINRGGGVKQVTYDGHPLYYFAQDTGAGETNGQGLNGFGALWWLVSPSGAAITSSGATTPSSPASSSPSGSGAGGGWS